MEQQNAVDLFEENGIDYTGVDLFNGEPPKSYDINRKAFNQVIDINQFKETSRLVDEKLSELKSKTKEEKDSFLGSLIELSRDENGKVNFEWYNPLSWIASGIAQVSDQKSIDDQIKTIEQNKDFIKNRISPEQFKQIEDFGPIGVYESFKRNIDAKNLPFIGSFVEGRRESRISDIMEKVRDGVALTENEEEKALGFVQNSIEESIRGHTLGGRIIDGVSILPAYMIEFAFAKGAFSKVSKAASLTKTGQRISAVEQAIEKSGKVGEIAGKTAKAVGVAGGRALFMPQMVYKNYEDLRLNNLYSIGSNGQFLFTENPENKATMVLKAFGLSTITSLSEESGETITALAKKGISPIYAKLPKKVRDGLVSLARQTERFKNTSVEKLFTKAGYSNMLAEIGEERLEDLLGAVTGLQPTEESYFDSIGSALLPGWDEFLVEAGVLSVPGAIRSTTSFLLNKGYSQDFIENLNTTEQDNLVDSEVKKEIAQLEKQKLPIETGLDVLQEELKTLETEQQQPTQEYEPGELEKEIDDVKQEIASYSDRKQQQFDMIQQTNPMSDDYHTGIRSVADIKTFEEAINDVESFTYGDYSKDDAERDKERGFVKVYSSHPIEEGGFISTSKRQAQDYAGQGKIYEKEVPIDDVAWINGDEGQYAPVISEEKKEEEKITGLSLSTIQRAIKKDIEVSQDNLPTYQKRNAAEIAKKVDDFIDNDKQLAIDIVKGIKPEVEGLFRQDLYAGLREKALNEGDYELLNQLARSATTGESTLLGQRIQALARGSEIDPVERIINLKKQRMKDRKVTEKRLSNEIKAESKKIDAEINKAAKNANWEEFLKTLEC